MGSIMRATSATARAARALLVPLIGCSLAACTSEAQKAEDRYEFLKEQLASPTEICGAAEDWMRAASATRDGDQYQAARREVASCGYAESHARALGRPVSLIDLGLISNDDLAAADALMNSGAK